MSDTSRKDWAENAQAALRGQPLASLTRYTEDNITRGPLYDASDLPDVIAPTARNAAPLLGQRPWHICAPVRDPDITFANAQLLRDLKGGASAARISLGDHALDLTGAGDIPRLLDQVQTDFIPFVLAPGYNARRFDLFESLSADHLFLGLCPGTEGLMDLAQKMPDTWQLITINAAEASENGATSAQELAYMAAGIAHTYRRLGSDLAARHIGVELTTDQDAHLNIAKMRAARRIHARIAQSFGADDARLTVHAISQKRMMQSVDPWTNMLRVMSAGFGAVTGGADFITLRPYTDAIGHADPFGYRIARNMQLMMMEESHLAQVVDPAYGSYFHEAMSEVLARAAWSNFQRIEAEGGFDNLSGFMTRISASTAERAAREEPVLGITLHPAKNVRPAKVRGMR
ncbi:methylmalonyl-CoA mutase family protein [Robiginitomaculum antarcticum]|uniref:methylmalonyl-CoA mutase family protein n=1 Tax=Robiginitomaculum antarcticum TaxID=437507 RepID=UPI0003641EE0|nr:methylmalonyl-CoA mutase family protein [Robiginitomaculum antarcticum]